MAFGLFSELLSLVSSEVGGIKYDINLREVPLLISLIFIRKPLVIGFYCIVLPIYGFLIKNSPIDIGLVVTHVPALFIAWFFFQRIKSVFLNLSAQAVLIFAGICGYYYLIMFPIVIGWKILIEGSRISVYEYYVLISKASLFEVIPTALIASLFLVQESMRAKLKNSNKNLEHIVSQRTLLLSQANEKLLIVNKEMTTLNNNLEELVVERTRKINFQLGRLEHYAYLNAHAVRGPLARILGLVNLLNMDPTINRLEYLRLLGVAADELDEVVNKMNKLLELEMVEGEGR